MSTPAILFRDGLAAADARQSLLCTDWQATYPIADAASLHRALAAADAARAVGQIAVFALNYELGDVFDPLLALSETASGQVPLGHVWVFQHGEWLSSAEADQWLQMRGGETPAGCERGQPGVSEAEYSECIAQIRQAIAEGEVYQINYTFPLAVTLYGHLARVFLQLAQAQPTAYGVYIEMPEVQALSLSPELFFAITGERIVVRPMKGTAPRAESTAEDALQAAQLQSSEKNRAENLMIVDLLRNDLGRIAHPGSVHVETLFEIEPYPTVHQMTSSISATLTTTALMDILRALFPCGSVTGAPKIAAMKKIKALETSPRGLYTGTIGWAMTDRIQANVAIRTLELQSVATAPTGAHHAVLGVGSGIVWDSEAAAEYAECLLKSAFIGRPDPGFTLFETLRLQMPLEGASAPDHLTACYPYYAWHRARLIASAEVLGFYVDPAVFDAYLWQGVRAVQAAGTFKPEQVFRVRVDVTHSGTWHLSWAALSDISEPVALLWSDVPLLDSNPLLRHKTSARALYDTAISRAEAAQAFDVLFCNQSAAVCEGARSNVFVWDGAQWLTPSLACGLLPGVLRQSLLDSGLARETLLTRAAVEEAAAAGRLCVGNALRGLLPAYLRLG